MKEELNSKNPKISKTAQVGGPVENCLFLLDTETVFIDALQFNRTFLVRFILPGAYFSCFCSSFSKFRANDSDEVFGRFFEMFV